jgi:aldose 1-epimerase
MGLSAAETRRVIAGKDESVIALTADDAMAELLPGLGCNCIRWQVGSRDLLYSPPLDELAERPTRGGIPILFPFPNRIRDGHFVWDGHSYQLPKNDSAKQNAIHGFSPRAPWRPIDRGTTATDAWLRAEFQISADARDCRNLWPADARLALTIRLSRSALRYEAAVENPDAKPLPFGLGYHPYFAVTPDCRVQTPARARWELIDGLPIGRRLPLEGAFDLREPRPVGELTLDDVYTDFPDTPPGADGLVERGRVEYPGIGALRVRTSPAFRELVLFTPPHRKAVCLEPYTCPTDAIHLKEREDVGWRVLPPGGRWEGMVEYVHASREA